MEENQPVEENKKMVKVPEIQLESLLSQIEDLKKERDTLLTVAHGILDVLGLKDENGNLRTEFLKEGGESPINQIVKAVPDIVTDMLTSKTPGPFGRRAEERINKKFGFVKLLTPIVLKYANHGRSEGN